jgi:hypothetical protein
MIVDGISMHTIPHERFTLIHGDVGPYFEGTVYCLESQLEQARAYYADSANYSYYCYIPYRSASRKLKDADPTMFDALIAFVEENEYDPFDPLGNYKIPKEEFPMPEDLWKKKLAFYKASKDGIFTSPTRRMLCVIDGELILAYQYDYSKGNERLIGVKVPQELADYFIPYFLNILP